MKQVADEHGDLPPNSNLPFFNREVEFHRSVEFNRSPIVMHPHKATQLVNEVLSKQYFRTESGAEQTGRDASSDLAFRHPSGRVLVEIKQVRTSSIADVLGRFALSLLKTPKNSGGPAHAILMHIVVIPRLGQKTKQAVQELMSSHSPNAAWGLIDHAGSFFICVPAWGLQLDEQSENSISHWPKSVSHLFTDLNCWMLKVLLLPDEPPARWGGPRQHVVTPTDLHRVAKVSVEKAHQFFRAFEEAGHLRRTRTRIEVIRKRALMDKWFQDEQTRPPVRMPARWIFGTPSSLDQIVLKPGSSKSSFAICAFEACSRMQMLHAPIPRTEIYVSMELKDALLNWDLEPCAEHSAHVYLRHAAFPKSIMRGVHVVENLPVVDVLQAALDVCHDAARGREQAEYVLDHVLKWKRGR